ncbi:hypothetical protein BS47DRAFT_1388640 [Hydnum rufescens UP504]|uniref:Uncharacterized protein n=1 Tax=Hydnum rufescens UP504 TaxID=1448309 RepID=A0A9P6DYZ2_9AGAM|nr:hypothetical protein BS47DRAFT_1388640 [Hydnum rufescens UP504]
MTVFPSQPFPPDSEQSQCLALCLAPPPEASAKGGVISLSPSYPLIPSYLAPNLSTPLCPSTTMSALLNLGGTSLQSHKELDHLKTDKWVNLQLNIRIVRDQILIKLRARKFELAGLDRADTGCKLDHRMKEHVEMAMKSRVSGVQGALKRYEEI